MTYVFGPDTALDELGLSERLGSWLFGAWFPLANRALADQEWRFDREKLRLSVRGESEHSGDPFTQGRIVNTLWYLNSMLPWPVVSVIGLLATPEAGVSSGIAVGVVSVVFLGTAVGAMLNVTASVDLASETQVVDHTTEPEPDAVATLREQYVDGEVDTATFEDRIEEVIDR